MITEIVLYRLRPNKSEEFNKLFMEQSLPMLKHWKINVIDYGFSMETENSFYLIRNYKSLRERQQSQDAFYGSDEWKNGPREPILKCIETYEKIVVENVMWQKNNRIF
jgi:hypothetical protein